MTQELVYGMKHVEHREEQQVNSLVHPDLPLVQTMVMHQVLSVIMMNPVLEVDIHHHPKMPALIQTVQQMELIQEVTVYIMKHVEAREELQVKMQIHKPVVSDHGETELVLVTMTETMHVITVDLIDVQEQDGLTQLQTVTMQVTWTDQIIVIMTMADLSMNQIHVHPPDAQVFHQ